MALKGYVSNKHLSFPPIMKVEDQGKRLYVTTMSRVCLRMNLHSIAL